MIRARRQRGVSLIELMVALLIGTVLVLGLLEVFAASRTAYQLSTGLARAQENARFAMDFLQRDLRMAGHMGCVNDQARFLPENITPSRPALVSTFLTSADQAAGNYEGVASEALRFDKSIEGFEAKGTGPGGTLTLLTDPVVSASPTDWEPAIPAHVFSLMNRPVKGSDIVFLRHFAPEPVPITTFSAGDPATIEFDPAQSGRLTAGVSDPRLFGIADCMTAAVFHGTSTSMVDGKVQVESISPNRSGLQVHNFAAGQATLHRAESVLLYVGENAQGQPALYRSRFQIDAAGAVAATSEELVEGVETMQLQYGLDSHSAAAQRPSGNIGVGKVASDFAGTASYEDAWRRVGMVHVALVTRSNERAAAQQRNVDPDNGTPPLSVIGLTVVPPNDGFYRGTYEGWIALRNRLFGN